MQVELDEWKDKNSNNYPNLLSSPLNSNLLSSPLKTSLRQEETASKNPYLKTYMMNANINPEGIYVSRMNYIRPSLFGGFLGKPYNHNTSGNCYYNSEGLNNLGMTGSQLNELFEPMQQKGVVRCLHWLVLLFSVLYIICFILQGSFTYLAEYSQNDNDDDWKEKERQKNHIEIKNQHDDDHSNWELEKYDEVAEAISIFVWAMNALMLVLALPLYYYTIQIVDQFIRDQNQTTFRHLGLKITAIKRPVDKFIICQGFKRIDIIHIQRIDTGNNNQSY